MRIFEMCLLPLDNAISVNVMTILAPSLALQNCFDLLLNTSHRWIMP